MPHDCRRRDRTPRRSLPCRGSAKWLRLEDVFARQLAQVTSTRAERPDAGEGRLLALGAGRPRRCRTDLVLEGIVDELRGFHPALARGPPRPLKQVGLDLDAGFFGGRHEVMVAAPSALADGLSRHP